MKKLKIFAALLAVSLVLTACGRNKDKNNDNSSGVVNDVVSGAEDVVSDVVSGTDEAMSDMMGDDNNNNGNNNNNDNNDNNNNNSGNSSLESDMSRDNSELNSTTQSQIGSATGELDSPAVQTQADLSEVDFHSLANLSNEKFGWGQGKDVDDANRPTSCLTYQEQYGNLDAYFIKENTKNIYLTFDEGYENGYTKQILDVLKEKNCPAVFFVTAPYVEENPDLIERMIQEGHVVGNHTVNHPSMPEVSTEDAAAEIADLHQTVKEKFGYTMTLFRPPMGEWSERTLSLTQQLGYKTVFWSFAYQDWVTDDQPDPAQSLQKLNNSLHNGAIYLLHAVSSTNTQILGDFIDNARSAGYTFATFR